jgi:hypothetical protein
VGSGKDEFFQRCDQPGVCARPRPANPGHLIFPSTFQRRGTRRGPTVRFGDQPFASGIDEQLNCRAELPIRNLNCVLIAIGSNPYKLLRCRMSSKRRIGAFDDC